MGSNTGNPTNHRSGIWFFLFITLLPRVFSAVLSSPDGLAIHGIEVHARIAKRIDVPSNFTTLTPSNATGTDIQRARRLVAEAIAEVTKHNKARVAFPARNIYSFKPGSNEHAPKEDPPKLSRRDVNIDALNNLKPEFNETVEAPELYVVPKEVKSAAALLAELEAQGQVKARKVHKRNEGVQVDQEAEELLKRQSSSWWMEDLAHLGTQPLGKDSSYKVFRNVKDYGAKGDGVTDDTAAINKAIADGNRCGAKCNGSTVKGAIVYFPAGTYLVSGTIEIFFNTQMIGNANNKPTIKAASSFIGLGVFSTDKYVEDGGTATIGHGKQWYINTANFYRQIRNFKIDITATNQGAYICALHYQVAQATSLENLEFIISTNPNTTQQAIFAENGSGGYMSDLTFNGGAFGIYGGSQQFTATRLRFNNVRTAVQLIWDWGWTWQDIYIKGGKTGFSLLSEDGTHHTGSVMIVDSTFENTETGILTFPPTTDIESGTTGITLDNVKFINVPNRVVDTANKSYLNDDNVNTWALGPLYFSDKNRNVALGAKFPTARDSMLVGSGGSLPKTPYFMRKRPQYENLPVGNFVQMKRFAKGDGVTDDTAAFQNVINQYATTDKVIYIDAGSYILKDTITIPPGAKIVGECWAQLVANGPKFNDAKVPRPLLRVGTTGSTGSVEIQDLLFTSMGETAGLITVEWNIKASSLGAAAMWDSHVRLGGATGTGLTHVECPASTNGTNSGCKAGVLMMHITKEASGYFENVWLWVADHTIDDPDMNSDNNPMPQCSIYVARGLLVESTDPVFLYSTSSEHSVFYQYNFYGAKHVLAVMIQTESPYYQPTPRPPEPFPISLGHDFSGDPEYQCTSGTELGCDAAWAVRIVDSSWITINGAGLYSWFKSYSQACVDTMNCQLGAMQLENNHGNVRIYNLITIGTVDMINADGKAVKAKDNLHVDFYPYWSQITVYDPVSHPPTKCKNGFSLPREVPVPSGTQTIPIPAVTDRFITLVNGTPYNWKKYNQHSYQMTKFDWPDVPAGESIQVRYVYDFFAAARGDSAGEAYYRIDGTSNTFAVKVSAKGGEHVDIVLDGMSTIDHPRGSVIRLGSIAEVSDGEGWHFYVGLNWAIVGNEQMGYWSSANLRSSLESWMSKYLDKLGNRKLKHICMPGSHDAGMSTLNGKTSAATQRNTQTQLLNIYDQLRRGSRYFDIRPVVGNGGQWLTGHYSNVVGIWQGANGESIDQIIADINKFTMLNGELIILYLSHTQDTDNGYHDLTPIQWTNLFNKLMGINRRWITNSQIASTYDLTDQTLNTFIGNGQSAVLIIAEGAPDNVLNQFRDAGQGFFGVSNFPRYDSYSESPSGQVMAEDQIAKLRGNRNLVLNDAERKEKFHVLSWTLTPGVGDIIFTSVEFLATFQAYNRLFWQGYPAFTPASYPNVLYMDFYASNDMFMERGWSYNKYYDQTTLEVLTLTLAVNLNLASANCYVADVNP